jgi:alpha-glucosidase
MKAKGKITLLFIAALQLAVFTATAQVKKISNGILVEVGKHEVGLTATKNAGFCLSVSDPAKPSAIKSIFIDEGDSAAPKYTVISSAPNYGIKTVYGKLMLNATTKTWSIYDAADHALVSDGTFSTTDSTILIYHSNSGLLYGSGNLASKSLEKNESKSSSGNGTAGIPYFWNTDGYSAFGVSANDNKPATWDCVKDKNILTWIFKGKEANLYLWPAKTMLDGAKGYVELTGRPKLPPRWAFGYLQSKWGWEDSAYIANVATKFREDKLPVDAFIFDFEWYTTTPDYFVKLQGKEGFTDFQFNPKLFPHPAKQIAALKDEGIKFIGIRKPRLGNDLRLDTARKNGWLSNPKTDRDMDFKNPGLEKWYEARNLPLLKAGVDAWWDDEGESYYTCYYWWNKTQYDLMAEARPNYRHFTLNRAFSPGNQRFGYCTWSGDIDPTWKSFQNMPKDLLNFSLAGMYYGSCDIGGFNGETTKELLVRWFEAGTFLPVMRSHSNIGKKAHFPYLWGEDGENAIRKALDLRYRLLPYTYSLGHEAYSTGAPIMRPLVMEFPKDTTVANMADEWLLGKGLLAAPLLNEGGKRSVYLPAGTWYNYFTGEAIKGPVTIQVQKALDEVPVYLHEGTILPLGPVIQYTEQSPGGPLEIHIYPGKNGSFNMVEDDGTSYNYIKGNTRITAYYWNDKTKTLSWNVSGPYNGKNVYRTIKVVLGGKEKAVAIRNKGSVKF